MATTPEEEFLALWERLLEDPENTELLLMAAALLDRPGRPLDGESVTSLANSMRPPGRGRPRQRDIDPWRDFSIAAAVRLHVLRDPRHRLANNPSTNASPAAGTLVASEFHLSPAAVEKIYRRFLPLLRALEHAYQLDCNDPEAVERLYADLAPPALTHPRRS